MISRDLITRASESMAAGNFPVKAPPVVELDEKSTDIVNRLFVELQAIFPAWKQAWPTDRALAAAKRSWVRGFMAAGIRDLNQIRFGLERCREHGSDFAPSVGKFIDWCRPSPESLGLPTVEQAYLTACRISHPAANRCDVHPAVWHAARETSLLALSTMPEVKSRPVFERAYALTVDMIIKGEPLREIPKALPEKVSVPADREKVKTALDEMRKLIRG